MCRSLRALGVSLAVHIALVTTMVDVSAWRTFSMEPKIQVQPIAVDLVKDLPLGAPPANEVEPAPEPPRPVRRPRHRAPAVHESLVVAVVADAGAPEPEIHAEAGRGHKAVDGCGNVDGGRRRSGDLRSSGPEGSRVVAFLHLDRLRISPDSEKTVAALDQLLLLLPDRKRLIDGTGLDLYRDFDSLLIATPIPTDTSVTFLAARHHLGDTALKAGLDRGAKAARRPIGWRDRDGRSFGIRKNLDSSAPGLDRDDRILLLPQNDLVIMAPPAYAALLLGVDPGASPSETTVPIDGSAIDGGSRDAQKIVTHTLWHDIVARFDVEDSAVPEDAVFMMSATNIFGPVIAPPGLVVRPTRGAPDDMPVQAAPVTSTAPEVVTLVVSAVVPYIHVIAEFKTEEDAEKWEQDLPAWRRNLLRNPIVQVSEFAPLIRRVEVSSEGRNVEFRVDTTVHEVQSILNLAASLARRALTAPR